MRETASRSERTLVVVRHAKAEATGPTDAERPLSERGWADAADAGRWLADQGIRPDHALVSSALRTQETWQELSTAAGWSTEQQSSSALYAASPETALDLVRGSPDTVSTLVVVGHNPTVASLAELLDDGDGDAAAMAELVSGGYPTCAMTVLTLDGPWSELTESSATVRAFHVGRA